MNADAEEQEDELLAFHSIFDSEEFVRKESKSAGEIRVSVELPADFTVSLKEGETLRQYEISFLPPLLLTFELPDDYPSSSPPSFTLTCSWLTHTQLSALRAQLSDLYQASGGSVVLFSWVQFLKEDALVFLDIHTLLDLPSDDEHSIQCDAALPGPKKHPLESGPTESQSSNASDLSAPSVQVEHPAVIPADGTDASTLDRRNTDSQGPVALIQNTSNSDSQHVAQASGPREAEQTLQTSKPPSDQSGREDFLNEELSPPSGSSDPLDQSDQGAASLPVPPRDLYSGLSLTPSQTLLSQLLIYDAAQKRKAFANTVFDCGVCFVGWLGSDCVQLPECGHVFCQACLAEFCKVQITEGNVRAVTCLEADCSATPTPAQVRRLVGEELFSRYDRLLLQTTLDCMADVMYCPRRSCGSAVIVEKSSAAGLCSVCSFAFCVACRRTYHGTADCRGKSSTKTHDAQQVSADLPQSQEGLKALWDDYASGSKQRRRLLESRYGRSRMLDTVEDCLSEDWIVFNSKNCPHCFCRIQKNQGCNVMTCSQCGRQFCWSCLTKLGTSDYKTHFVDGSCTSY